MTERTEKKTNEALRAVRGRTPARSVIILTNTRMAYPTSVVARHHDRGETW